MIIQIRGTSGSGKTHVMRKVMEALGPWGPRYEGDRKKPLFYSNRNGVAVLGHYESACGGCDNIGSAAQVAELVKGLQDGSYLHVPRIILSEGLLLSEDTKWSSQMKDLRVVYLTTPLETCLSQITSRRLAAGNTKELNPANTTNRVRVIERSRLKLVEAGVVCRRANTKQAIALILDWIENAK